MGDWFFFGGGNRRKTGHGTNVRARLDERERLFRKRNKSPPHTHIHTHIYINRKGMRER